MVHDLAELDRTVQSVLNSKRIGTPVFVRLRQQAAAKPGSLVERLANLCSLVTRWLGQPLRQLYTVGSVDRGEMMMTLMFSQGANALVSVGTGDPNQAIDLLFLGSRGTIQHEASVAFSAGKDLSDPRMMKWIRRALTSNTPINVEAP
jgi:hypothetical protein